MTRKQGIKDYGKDIWSGSNMKKVAFFTLGCKVNQYETEAVSELFKNAGYQLVGFDYMADVYIINTCTVTNLSDKKSRQMIRKAKKNNPDGIVVAMGCYAQVSKEEVEKIEGVDIVMGTKDRIKVLEWVGDYLKNKQSGITTSITRVHDIMKAHEFEALSIHDFSDRTRAYIKIQDGCNQFCAYCIIPYARGTVRSKNLDDIHNEVVSLVSNGFKEIVLTGIHLASYGKDTNINLVDVFRKLDNIVGLERIRLGSLEPNVVSDDFVNYISQHKKICPQFHLSLQSGCDETLLRMNRKYTTEEYRTSANLLKNKIKDATLTTDIIVGFPGESEEEFQKTLLFAEEIAFSKIHVFKFSARKGTKAFSMKNKVAPELKEERAKILSDLSNKLQRDFIEKYLGEQVEILLDGKEENGKYMHGYTSNYIKVVVEAPELMKGAILKVLIVKSQNDCLNGIIVS